MAFLELKNVGKIYASEGNIAVGIRSVDLSFERGEIVAVTGASGSGKSTLAAELARAVNCESRTENAALPCGECSACKRILEGNFPDVKILTKPSDRAG